MYVLIINDKAEIVSNSRTKLYTWAKNNWDGGSLFVFQKIAFSSEVKVLYNDKILGYIREIKVL